MTTEKVNVINLRSTYEGVTEKKLYDRGTTSYHEAFLSLFGHYYLKMSTQNKHI